MWSRFKITSPDSPTAVGERIAAVVAMAPKGGWPGPLSFSGKVWHDGFRITRDLVWAERVLPIVATGKILLAEGGGTVVEVGTRPQWWTVLIIGVFSAWPLPLIWQRLVSNPLPGEIHWGEIAVLAGFMTFGWVLLFIACTVEERRYQRALTEIVNPTEKDSEGG